MNTGGATACEICSLSCKNLPHNTAKICSKWYIIKQKKGQDISQLK